MPLLEVENLHVSLRTSDGELRAVQDVSFALDAGETLAIVGESGCGKSMTALSLLQLVPSPPARIHSGHIWLQRQVSVPLTQPSPQRERGADTSQHAAGGIHRVDLLQLSADALCEVRGKDIAMIFQEPMSALNPVMRIGDQIAEAIFVHQPKNGVASAAAVQSQVIELLRTVGIAKPEIRARDYPHQLSGGMRQRAMIAMALSCRPRVLIADEPTTALDATIQAQILRLLKDLQRQFGMGLLLITHDFGVVAHMADRVAVMYAGKIVEHGAVRDVLSDPRHPYTAGLLRAVPSFQKRGTRARFATIPGRVPHLARLPVGCAFAPRCPNAQARCRVEIPQQEGDAAGQQYRCWFPHDKDGR